MRVFVDGKERKLPEKHEYALGPLRVKLTEDQAEAYNEIVGMIFEAKLRFLIKNDRAWRAGEHLNLPAPNPIKFRLFISVGHILEEAGMNYEGPEIDEATLGSCTLERVW